MSRRESTDLRLRQWGHDNGIIRIDGTVRFDQKEGNKEIIRIIFALSEGLKCLHPSNTSSGRRV